MYEREYDCSYDFKGWSRTVYTVYTVLLTVSPASGGWCNVPGSGVVLGPNPDKLVQVMRSQDGRVSGQVLKVVHDDRHKQVQHLHTQLDLDGT